MRAGSRDIGSHSESREEQRGKDGECRSLTTSIRPYVCVVFCSRCSDVSPRVLSSLIPDPGIPVSAVLKESSSGEDEPVADADDETEIRGEKELLRIRRLRRCVFRASNAAADSTA